MQHAVAYYRVSTARQGRSGLGIEAQRAAVQRFAEAEGFELSGEFVEVENWQGLGRARPPPTARRGALGGAYRQMPGDRRQAGPAVARRRIHCRAHGAARSSTAAPGSSHGYVVDMVAAGREHGA
jgi:hypothetical protein